MCGIGGVLRFDGCAPGVAGIAAMLEALDHRGPDDRAVHVQPPIGFAHTRLSVIDLSPAGRQPMQLDDLPLWIVYNGETYNHREIRRQLESRGHRFRSSSDTEVILRAYVEWGDACVTRLNGMFAFAIWDSAAQRLFLARDRLGIKPLYYLVDRASRELVFGSEIKTILAYRRHAPEIDAGSLDSFFAFGYIPLFGTPFKGLLKLPPAHTLTASAATTTVETRPYWDLRFSSPDDRRRPTAEELVEALDSSVRRNLVADVPVGAFLSGGIDSSAVVSFMRRSYPGTVKTFSVGFEQASYDERRFARVVARRLDTEHHEVVCTATDFRDLWARTVRHADGLAADISNVPLYMVAQEARRHVPVVLSGDGGDELFAGYAIYQADRLASIYRRAPAVARRILRAATRILPTSTEKMSFDFKLKQFLSGAALGEAARSHFAWRRIFSELELEALLTTDVSVTAREELDDRVANVFRNAPAGSDLQRGLYADIKTFLVDSILAKVDGMTMAHGLEARVPLLDHELVELAARIPDRMKLRGGTGKKIFKTVMRGRLPTEVLERGKSPFQPPLAGWLRSELRQTVCEVLDEVHLKKLGLFKTDYVEALKREHFAGVANHAFKLWALMNFVEWHRRFVESSWRHASTTGDAA